MIDTDKYQKYVSERRTDQRGFTDITISLFTDFQRNRPIELLCELGGLGRSKKPQMWHDSSSGNFKEVVVDNVVLHTLNNYDIQGEIEACNSIGTEVIIVENAYSLEAKELALKSIAPSKFDVLIDDAGSTWPMTRNSLPIYKDSIADDGLYITETPDGNGDTLVGVPWNGEKRTASLTEVSQNGMVIFNMETFTRYINREASTSMGGNQIGIYSPNFDIFKDTINAYKDYIIYGREFVEHLIN